MYYDNYWEKYFLKMLYTTEHMVNIKQPNTNQQITSWNQNDRHQVTLSLDPAPKINWDSFFSQFLHTSHSDVDGL